MLNRCLIYENENAGMKMKSKFCDSLVLNIGATDSK